MPDTLLSLANAALLQQRPERAIRLYVEILRRQPEMREHVAFNLKLARGRYRAARRGERPEIAVCGRAEGDDIAARAATLAGVYRKFAPTRIVGVSLPEADGTRWEPAGNAGVPCRTIRAEGARDLLPRALDLVLSRPCDIVHLCHPNLPNVVLGTLYKLVWDARVIVDIDGEQADGTQSGARRDPMAWLRAADDTPLDLLGAEWAARAFGLYRTFDGVTTPSAALQRRHGGVIVREETPPGGEAELRAVLDMPPAAPAREKPQELLVDRLGGWDAFRYEALPAKPRKVPAEDDLRIIVYSVLVGDHEAVGEPATLNPDARYILFTDNPDLKSEKWEVVPFDTGGLSPRRASRLPKLLPHRYLPPHDVSIYMDAGLTPIEYDVAAMADRCLQGYDIAAYPHHSSDCTYAEIEEHERLGSMDKAQAKQLRQRLASGKFPRNYGLLEDAFLIRRDTPVTRRINELWAREFLEGAGRDRFHLMHVLWRSDIPYSAIADSPNLRESPNVLFTSHVGAGEATDDAPPGVDWTPGFLGDRDPAMLKKRCEDILATAAGADTLLSSSVGAATKKFGKAPPLQALANAIVELESQGQVSAQTYRFQLSGRLFPTATARPARPGHIKIGYIANSAMPTIAANNVHVMKMCSALTGTGTDVTLYAEKAQDDFVSGNLDAIHEAFGTQHRFPIRFLENDQRGREHLLYRLVRLAVIEGCTHIYTRSLDAAVFAAIADMPTILERHQAIVGKQLGKLEFLARSPAFEKLVVISKPLVDQLKGSLRGLEDKTVVLHDGADPVTAGAPPFDLHRSAGAKLHVGYVGDLHAGKGAEISLELARRMPHVDFHMLGGTPENTELWKRKAERVPNIKFYGYRQHREVSSFIEEMDIVIAPLLGEVGTHGADHRSAVFFPPRKIFEYMAHGKAIVASDLPVLHEVLDHRGNALLCEPDAIESFVAGIEELGADPALRTRLGAAARQRFEAAYTWSMRASGILRILGNKPNLECGTEGVSVSIPANGVRQRPLMRWYIGGETQKGWAYGINSNRLSSRILSCEHVVSGSAIDEAKPVEVALAFDILIMNRKEFMASGAYAKILRVGGPTPLKLFSGGNLKGLAAALAEADAIIALSPQLREELCVLHPAVYFIPNGIDLDAFHPSRRRRASGEPFTVGMSASMQNEGQSHTKGYYFAAEACEIAGVDLLAVGRGVNQIPHDRLIEDFYSKIDVLIHPVGAGKEASSNVIMESLSLGIPVVTTRYAGFHGVALEDGVEALITRRTAGDLAGALMRLHDDEKLRETLARGGRAFAERHHPLDLIARKYEAVIWSCLSKQRAEAPISLERDTNENRV